MYGVTEEEILAAKSRGDSVGGMIECVAEGVPAGWGEPMFGGIENRIAQAVFAIPGIKAIEFGDTKHKGSENNDPFCVVDGVVRTRTNNHGGILGGITSGMPVVFRVKCKPTPSIAAEQDGVMLSANQPVVTALRVRGRHDPCIVPRAVPCVEAAAAVALYDAYLEST
jgi:chorismate synthase